MRTSALLFGQRMMCIIYMNLDVYITVLSYKLEVPLGKYQRGEIIFFLWNVWKTTFVFCIFWNITQRVY